MKRFRHLLSPYSLTLILPVLIAALLTGGLNLVSFLELQEDHRVAHVLEQQKSNEGHRDHHDDGLQQSTKNESAHRLKKDSEGGC